MRKGKERSWPQVGGATHIERAFLPCLALQDAWNGGSTPEAAAPQKDCLPFLP
jgi:hypothetical protein